MSTYRSFMGSNCEICIESGFRCIDLAVYGLDKELLEPKVTINSPELGKSSFTKIIDYVKQVDAVVNRFYKKWELKNGKKT